MKLKNLLYMGGLMAGLVLTAACDDELSALPSQSKVDGNVVVDQKSAEAALNGIYYTFAQCGTDYYDIETTNCVNLYEIYPASVAGTITYYQGPYLFETHGGIYYAYYSSILWSPLYQAMTTINSVIDQVTKADDSWFTGNRKTEILAEARCMRGIVNYNLLRLFGYSWDIDSPYGNILRMEATTSSNLSCPRSSVRETYEAILSDLDYAIENCVSESENYYANSWVAKGQKVRTLMLRGQEGDYAEAASIANDIIRNSPYTLEEHTTDIFHVKGLASEEVMFGIKPQSTTGQQTAVIEAYYYRNSPQYYYTDNFWAMLEGDPRKEELSHEVQSIIYVYDFDENGNYVGYHRETISVYAICKHMVPGVMAANEVEESQYMMRLTEMYLLRAEALVRANGTAGLTEAKALLQTVMEHAGLTDFTELEAANDEMSFYQLYFEEYLKNLFCENGLELDIMYRMPKEIVQAFNPEYYETLYDDQYNVIGVGEHRFGLSVFAIPSDEFQNNYLLTNEDQNPGYSAS